eukprot:748587-Hanusia_phi.AAC.1
MRILAAGRGAAAAAMAAMTIMSGTRATRGGRTLCMKGGDGTVDGAPQDFASSVRAVCGCEQAVRWQFAIDLHAAADAFRWSRGACAEGCPGGFQVKP